MGSKNMGKCFIIIHVLSEKYEHYTYHTRRCFSTNFVNCNKQFEYTIYL